MTIPISFRQTRLTLPWRDDIYMVTAGLSRPITQHLFLGVQYSYTRDKANISLFNYERMVYSITLNGSF